MKFQNPNITNQKFQTSLKNGKSVKISKFRIVVKFDRKFSKVNKVIYSSAQTSIPNMKALAQILF